MTTPSVRTRGSSARRGRNRGVSMLYMAVAIVAIIALVSLAVDVGRIRVAKGQMQTAADAASMAGALAIPFVSLPNNYNFNDIDAEAANLAAANRVTIDNHTLSLNAVNDIEYGIWNSTNRTFTITPRGDNQPGDPRQRANAMRVTTRRLSSRGNALGMTFARIFQHNTQDIVATSTAVVLGGPQNGFGIIGLNSVGSQGGNKATIDSYLPALGLYESQPPRHNANTASNGPISIGNADIYGDARPGIGQPAPTTGPNGMITGWTANLDTPLVFPPKSVPGGTPVLPDTNPLPGGTTNNPVVYQTDSFPPSRNWTVNGAAVIYVTGDVDVKANGVVRSSNYLPANLKIIVVGNGQVDMKGGARLYAHVYAPSSNFHMNGDNQFYGAIVAGSIFWQGTPNIHYDESNNGGPAGPFNVVIVK